MMPFALPSWWIALTPLHPELLLLCGAMLFLLAGTSKSATIGTQISGLSAMLLWAAALLVSLGDHGLHSFFNGMLALDPYTQFMKWLVLVGAGLVSIMLHTQMKADQIPQKAEFSVLILFSVLGMMLMISAQTLIALYMAIELMSLSLYVLAAFYRDDARSSEAALKYFVLGAVASGFILFGSSLLYGYTGTVHFSEMAVQLSDARPGAVSIGVLLGLVFVVAGLCFKVSAVPFHMWAPDVYEGVPVPVVTFFASVPKVAALAVFLRVMMEPFATLVLQWQSLILIASAASMLLGAFAGLKQQNIKRLLAYSSIGHVGYVLLGVLAANREGVQGVVVYLALYLLMSIGMFGFVLMMRRKGEQLENIDDLRGLYHTHPTMAFGMAVLLFSMAGIPPFAGFFAKLMVLKAAISAGFYPLALIGVLASVVAAFYYLRIVKIMYLDQPGSVPIDHAGATGSGVRLVVGGMVLATMLYGVFPSALMRWANEAATALLM
jgi:NADH-quinone oxidoreductase subunit N